MAKKTAEAAIEAAEIKEVPETAAKRDWTKIPGTVEELKAYIDEIVKAYNGYVMEEDYKSAYELNSKTEEAVNKYTGLARRKCFDELAAIGDKTVIMQKACEQFTFESVRVNDREDKESGIVTRIVEPTNRPIDLLALNKHVPDGIGADKNWPYMIQKLNALLTFRECERLGYSADRRKATMDNYNMDAIARDIDMGKTPLSNTNIVKTLNTILAAMVGMGYKGTMHDVNHMLDTYTKTSREATKVKCATHKYLTNELQRIAHRLITGKSWEIEQKEKKSK